LANAWHVYEAEEHYLGSTNQRAVFDPAGALWTHIKHTPDATQLMGNDHALAIVTPKPDGRLLEFGAAADNPYARMLLLAAVLLIPD
jgi:hypothetical protein